jgi:hypothetical protein
MGCTRHDNKLVTNISLKVQKELPYSKEFTLFYFIVYTDLYLLINRSIRCLVTGVIMYTIEIYMETDETCYCQYSLVSFYRKGCAPSPLPGRAKKAAFPLKLCTVGELKHTEGW